MLRHWRRFVIFAIPVALTYTVIMNLTYTNDDYMDFVYGANETSLSDIFIHEHKYHLLLNNESICGGSVFLVILVNSDPEHSDVREAIRETWGSVKQINGASLRVVFLVGSRVQTKGLTGRLQKESERFGDMVMGTFNDSYLNMTYKTVMGLHWMNSYCRKATFVMKSDDDVMINIYKLVYFLQELIKTKSESHNFYFGLAMQPSPFRSNTSKWYMSYSDYKYSQYPPYCLGSGYVLSNDVAIKIYGVTKQVPFFWIDDVYMGFCAKLLNIELTDQSFGYYFVVPHYRFDRPWELTISKVMERDIKELKESWNYIQSVKDISVSQYVLSMLALLAICVLILVIALIYFYRSTSKNCYILRRRSISVKN